jgi:nucleotide-binding universal stress UspA family protein
MYILRSRTQKAGETMETRFSNILCATDFSKHSQPVLDYATELALRFKAHLIVFHSVCLPGSPMYGTARSRQADAEEGPIHRACDQIRNLMKDHPISWEPLVRYGEPVEEILKVGDQRSFELVVAASYRLSGWKRILAGTVVEQLARNIDRPLLVVNSRRTAAGKFRQNRLHLKNIMVGCDLSDQSHRVFQFAHQFARAFDAKLHFVHAIEAPMNTAIVEPTAAPYGEVQRRLQNELHRRLIQIIPEEERGRPDYTTAVLPGGADDVLSEYAKRNRIDLIVAGVRPHGPIEKLLIGSTTETMLRNAPCEVLTVPLTKIPRKPSMQKRSA